MTVQELLIHQKTRPATNSKKWRSTMIGLRIVCGIFFLTFLGILLDKPEKAIHYISLANYAILAVGGLIAVYNGAQASVDYRNTGALETLNTKEEVNHTFTINPELNTPELQERYAHK